MVSLTDLTSGAIKVNRALSMMPSMPLPGHVGIVINLAKLATGLSAAAAYEYQKLRKEIREEEDRVERRILKYDAGILKKKIQICERISRIKAEVGDDASVEKARQELAVLGAKLIRLEGIKDKLEAKKEELRQSEGFRGHFRHIRNVAWLHIELRRLDWIERKISVEEEHVTKLLEEVVAYLQKREKWVKNEEAAKHFSELEALVDDFLKIVSQEAKAEAAEAIEEEREAK